MEERLRRLLKIALQYHVTDIHFNIFQNQQVTIEMRVDGVICQLKPMENDLAFFRFLLYRANLDLSDSLAPQTGRFEIDVDGKMLALRFAIVSGFSIQSGVLRILNNHRVLRIEDLSSDQSQAKWFHQICMHRNGLFIFSGPTGSGKTTSLYTILDAVKGKKIFSLEDPVEVYSEKYVQIQINEKQHLGYAEGIRQLMRHDPDIIFIGEIRDGQAAQMAVRSALTGHVVLTSLHASSCVGAMERMCELGVLKTQLMDVLMGLSNQRLYDTANHTKIGVYEIMDQKEVSTYYQTGHNSADFEPITKKIQQAVVQGLVPAGQAQQDLLG